MGRTKCVPEPNGRIEVFILACSADSVTVIEVRRYFYICRLSKVEPRIISVFAMFCKDGVFLLPKRR